MIHKNGKLGKGMMVAALMTAVLATLFGFETCASADKSIAAKGAASALPADLFVSQAPPNALAVEEARKTAQEGKAVVIRGRIGGVAKPIADKYAMFLVTDLSLEICKDACGNPFCQIPQEQLLTKVATVQVVDSSGRPIKASMEGMNGLKPLAEVVVSGTVGKVQNNVLIVNARNIFVETGKKQ